MTEEKNAAEERHTSRFPMWGLGVGGVCVGGHYSKTGSREQEQFITRRMTVVCESVFVQAFSVLFCFLYDYRITGAVQP